MGAAHELEQMSATGARTLLQRGIRINGESMELWKEYVKMEMGFIEQLRRRREVLGVEMDDGVRIVETVITQAVQGAITIAVVGPCVSDCCSSCPWIGIGASDL